MEQFPELSGVPMREKLNSLIKYKFVFHFVKYNSYELGICFNIHKHIYYGTKPDIYLKIQFIKYVFIVGFMNFPNI